MKRTTSICLAIAFILGISIVFVSCKNDHRNDKDNILVILSMDGFRWDYTEMTSTPTLDSIAQNGVKAVSFKPAFPTKTFPNHYSLATGLYPDNHGIVQNNFYDADMDAIFRLGDRNSVEDGRFYGGEPIWVTAEKQGITSASFYWVGSEAPIQGIQPTYWKQYDSRVPNKDRVDTIIKWLQLPEEKSPRLIMWYFSEPDGVGHRYGPGTPIVNAMVTEVDSLVGVFMKKLNELPNKKNIDFIVLSDHGMSHTSFKRYINLSDYLKEEWIERAHGGNPAIIVQAAENCTDSILNALSEVKHLKAWKNDDIPERFNYGNNPRTLDILILADNTWSIGWRPANTGYIGASHGYDNDVMDMHAIFYAIGPSFRKGYSHPVLEVVDLYPLAAHLLGLNPAEMDGKLERTKGMLRR